MFLQETYIRAVDKAQFHKRGGHIDFPQDAEAFALLYASIGIAVIYALHGADQLLFDAGGQPPTLAWMETKTSASQWLASAVTSLAVDTLTVQEWMETGKRSLRLGSTKTQQETGFFFTRLDGQPHEKRQYI